MSSARPASRSRSRSAFGFAVAAAVRSPLAPGALRTAAASVGILASLALAGGGVRVLPWILDDGVSFRVALPFARAVFSVALEAAVLVGWPVGWALAAFALAERGEARVLALLGQRPLRSVAGLAPMALLFGAVLGAASLAGGRDASEPGRVVGELLNEGRAACVAGASGGRARAIDVPLVGATWLCGASHVGDATGASGPRLVGAPRSGVRGRAAGDALYTARSIRVSPDARRVELGDAWLALGGGGEHEGDGALAMVRAGARAHVGEVVLALPPFVRASSLAPGWRAVLLASSGAGAALFAVWLVLALAARPDHGDHASTGMWRLHAIALGAAGPVGVLALLHALERADAPARAFAWLLPAALGLTGAAGGVVWCLLAQRAAASK